MSVTAYISIGSNSPDRAANMTAAIDALSRRFDTFVCSEIYQTPCCNGIGADYLNAVARVVTDMPQNVMEKLFKQMETDSGRTDDPATRRIIVPLDIDLVVYDGRVIRPRDFGRQYFTKGYLSIMNPRTIQIIDYIYDLPDNRIAQHPLAQRDACKLLVSDSNGVLADTTFDKIGDFMAPDAMLVYNNTRVINARLRFHKSTGSLIEIFCLEPVSPNDYQLNFSSTEPVDWKCLVGNSKRWKSGPLEQNVTIGNKTVMLTAERLQNLGADSIIRFGWSDTSLTFSDIIAAVGEIPIPPYLNRSTEASDSSDYQTVYNRVEGSVAAPTAGLHFTDGLLAELDSRGIQRRNVTLHVGAGTFKPVKTDSIGEHPMHAELIDVERALIDELADTQRPVTAVGTTTVRTLESLYHIGCQMATNTWKGELDQWYPYSPDHPQLTVRDALKAVVAYLDTHNLQRLVTSTRIIIAPGYHYRVVSDLITNFHQPGSTLLLLVAAIVGDRWRDIYDYAICHDYRFLSYGDANLMHIR